MNTLMKFLAWDRLLILLTVLLVMAIAITFYFWFDGAFSGVDGGIGLVVAIFYCIVGAIAIGAVAAIDQLTRRWRRVNSIALLTLWGILVGCCIMVSFSLYLETIEPSCTSRLKPNAAVEYNPATDRLESVCGV